MISGQLIVISGSEDAVYPLVDYVRDSVATIGRASESDIQLASESVSRYHAMIIATADGYQIVDMESRNGVTVNGAKVFMEVLRSGDEIGIGHVQMRYEVRAVTRKRVSGKARKRST